jgi:hypothetical protein
VCHWLCQCLCGHESPEGHWQSQSHTLTTSAYRLVRLILLTSLLIPLVPRVSYAQDANGTRPAVETPEEKQKREAVVIGGLMLILVVVTGIGLVAMVLILGRRMRRLTRKTLPTAGPTDDLWFLRKPKRSEPDRDAEHPE